MSLDHQRWVAAISPAIDALAALESASRQARGAPRLDPAAGSIALGERQNDASFRDLWGQNPAADAHSTIGLLMIAAESHIGAMRALHLDPEAHAFADKVIGRAAIEAMAWAVWLCEPAIGLEERIVRNLNLRLASEFDKKKAIPHFHSDSTERILESARRRQIRIIRETRRYPPSIRKGLPKVTDLAQQLYLDDAGRKQRFGSVLYRWWSGVAHASMHALVEPIDTDYGSNPASSPDGLALKPIKVNSNSVTIATFCVGRAYALATDRWHVLNGWKSPEFVEAVQTYQDFVQAKLRTMDLSA